MSNSAKYGYLIILALALLPALYLFFLPNSLDFSNFSSSMLSLGRISGLVGTVLFSLSFLLSTRLRFTERLFFGLDKSYKAHHILGTTAFLLLLFHPLFLASQFIAVSSSAALNFLYPFNSPNIAFGTIGLLLMTFFLIITFFAKINYEKWKFLHSLLGIAFVLASLHILLVTSDVSRNLFLRIYMIIFIIIGIGSYLYRGVFWKKFVSRYDYKIKSIKKQNTILEIALEPVSKKLDFIPGQFAFISLETENLPKEPHPFTICSSSYNKDLCYSIKDLGDFTGRLDSLKVGDRAKIEGPFGKFSFVNYPSNNYIFIAGGIGITPFLSMLRSISDNPDKYNFTSIDIYYSINTEKEAIYLKELEKISQDLPKNKQLKVFPYIAEKQGFLTSSYIEKNSKGLKDSHIFICGPPAMMASLKDQLIRSGINKKNIHTEEFGFA